jgi:HSP20 family molecular chaperone IbpA
MIRREMYVDVCEGPELLQIWADLPGVDESSVDVSVDRDLLTVSAELAAPDPGAGPAPAHREQELGRFERSFHLSGDLDTDAIEARMRDGVLELRVPKVEHAKPRRIEVSAS